MALPTSGWHHIYFDAPTRGEQIRVLFKLAKVELTESRPDFPHGLDKYKRAALGPRSPLMFDQCPCVRSPNGIWVSQTAACMQFVGRSLSLAPKDEAQDARALALTLGSEEFRNSVFYKLLIASIICKALTIRFCGIFCCLIPLIRWWFGTSSVTRTMPQKLQYFENQLADTNTDFFCGNSPTYADVALFDCIRETLALYLVDSDRINSQFPKIKAFIDRMDAIPELSEYFSQRGGYAIDILLAKHALPPTGDKRDNRHSTKKQGEEDGLYASLIAIVV